MSETPDTQPQSMAPGQILKRAREGKNLTVAAIATLMNLDLRTVEALERGNQNELPAPIFVRGYLRGYARLVGVDEAAVLEAYQAQNPQEPKPRPVGMSRVPVRPAFRAPAITLKAVFLVIVLLLLAWIGVEWGPDLIARVSGDAAQETAAVVESARVPNAEPNAQQVTLPNAEQARSDAEQVASDTADMGPKVSPESPEQSVVQTESNGPASVPLDLPTPQPVPAAEAPPLVAQPEPELPAESEFATPAVITPEATPVQAVAGVGELRLELRINSDSWVEIKGADGESLLLGLLHKGDTRSVTGKAPMTVVLGNAAGVEVQVDGKLFELGRYTRDNIARFEINP
jgi:cytoskeleton protein RodZ